MTTKPRLTSRAKSPKPTPATKAPDPAPAAPAKKTSLADAARAAKVDPKVARRRLRNYAKAKKIDSWQSLPLAEQLKAAGIKSA